MKPESKGKSLPTGRSDTLQVVGRLSAGIAHQLRNPLGVIRTAVWNIRRKRTNTEIDRHLDNIEKKIDQGVRALEDLLEFARVGEPVKVRFELAGLVEEVLDRISNAPGRESVVRGTDLSVLRGLEAEADREHLGRVLSEMIENAAIAAGEGGGPVSVESAVEGGEAVISFVFDTEEEEAEAVGRIFEPFRSSRPGTTLGLSLARLLMEANGGRMEVRALDGRRAVFRAYIPVAVRP